MLGLVLHIVNNVLTNKYAILQAGTPANEENIRLMARVRTLEAQNQLLHETSQVEIAVRKHVQQQCVIAGSKPASSHDQDP